jgi:hypothetical protein
MPVSYFGLQSVVMVGINLLSEFHGELRLHDDCQSIVFDFGEAKMLAYVARI